MVKIIFFDFDGTIYSHASKSIPESTIKAFEILRQKGIKTFLCTGRAVNELDHFDLSALHFDGYITTNGGLVSDSDFNILYENNMKGELLDLVIKDFHDKKVPIMLTNPKNQYMNFINQKVKEVQEEISTPVAPIGEYQGEDIIMACYYFNDRNRDLESVEKVSTITSWNNYAVDVVPKGASKSSGIENCLRILGLKKEETMAFGDGDNDIEMMKYCKYSIAMSNGNDEVKKYATYVTSDIDEDGIYKALEHYDII